MKITAVIVAAGRGLRMGGTVPKQYLLLRGRPVLHYTLRAFEESSVNEVVIVCPDGDEEYVRTDIVGAGGFTKVQKIVPGGAERFDSCYRGIMAAEDADRILIHDGVRALITPQEIDRLVSSLTEYKACVLAVPVKDTIRRAGLYTAEERGCDAAGREQRKGQSGSADGGFPAERSAGVISRECLRAVQTPQGFEAKLIRAAYEKYYDTLQLCESLADTPAAGNAVPGITDDAMLVEEYTDEKVYIIEGSYSNIKITTPEDMIFAEAVLAEKEKTIKL